MHLGALERVLEPIEEACGPGQILGGSRAAPAESMHGDEQPAEAAHEGRAALNAMVNLRADGGHGRTSVGGLRDALLQMR